MSASEIRANARKALEGKWGKGALITLVYVLVMFVLEFVLGFIPLLGSIASIVISAPISYGIMVAFMKLKRGEEVTYTGFLEYGFSNFGKVWGVFGHTILKLLVPMIIFFVCLILFLTGTVGSVFSLTNGSSFAGFSGLTIVALIGYIASAIFLVVKGLLYSLTNYLLYDNQNMTSKEIVEESERLMNGNRGKYVWLELTFIGWLVLSIFTLYIGLLWVAPYMSVAFVCFYETLIGKTSNDEVVEIENVDPIQ